MLIIRILPLLLTGRGEAVFPRPEVKGKKDERETKKRKGSAFQRIDPLDDVDDFHPFEYVGGNDFVGRVRQHVHDVADDEMVVLRRSFIGSVIIARIGRGELRHLVSFDMAIFDFVHVLAADLHASFFGYDQQAAFHVLIPYRRRIGETAHPAADKIETDETRIFESGQCLVVEIGETGLDVAYIAEQPVHDVDEMGELGE